MEWILDSVALVGAGVAVWIARKAQLRADRERARADRLYHRMARRFNDHVESRLHR